MPTKKNRCEFDDCKKKLPLIPFTCDCKGKFCSIHRYNFTHNCTFDYKDKQRTILKNNYSDDAKPQKINKI